MNSNTQAQKGFKTFILTLVTSLAVFSAIYYVVNSDSSPSSNKDAVAMDDSSVVVSKSDSVKTSTLGDKSARPSTPIAVVDTSLEKNEPESVFKELATDSMNVSSRQVLAGETEAVVAPVTTPQAVVSEVPQTTVPDTGVLGPTTGIIVSLIVLSIFGYLMFLGPRRLALSSFEKDVLDDLD